MTDLRLSDEQLAIQELAREFVEREVAPVVLERDRIERFDERFPWDVVVKGSQLGLRTIGLSRQRGGGGFDTLTECLVAEELGVGDLGIAITLTHTSALSAMLFDSAMNDEQRARFLPGFLADDAYHLAIAFHEPDTDVGYDYFVEEVPVEGDKTVAHQQADGSWVINGVKNFQTNGYIARLIAVRAKTEYGPTIFLVPGDTRGLKRQPLDPSGRRLASWAELSFESCVVPAENVLGAPGDPRITRLGPGSAPRQGAANLGVGRAAFEAALAYARQRVQGGKPIIAHQAVGLALGEMATKLEAARAFIWRAAWAADHQDELDRAGLGVVPLGRMPVLFASQIALEVALRASTLFGGIGISRSMPLQKYIRDAQVYHHSAPHDLGYLKVAELLAGYRRAVRPWVHS